MPSGVAAAQRLSGRLPGTSVGLGVSQIKTVARDWRYFSPFPLPASSLPAADNAMACR